MDYDYDYDGDGEMTGNVRDILRTFASDDLERMIDEMGDAFDDDDDDYDDDDGDDY